MALLESLVMRMTDEELDALDMRSDIPIPSKGVGVGRPARYPFAEMVSGDSFDIEDAELSSARVSVCRENKKGDAKFIVGKHQNEWRCWRIV
jgi:hypothetical protein